MIIQTMISVLKRYHVTGLYLFGSVAEGRSTASSDVDIAVEGLSGSDYFDAMVALSDALERDVDLIRMENVTSRMRQHIYAIGEPVAV